MRTITRILAGACLGTVSALLLVSATPTSAPTFCGYLNDCTASYVATLGPAYPCTNFSLSAPATTLVDADCTCSGTCVAGSTPCVSSVSATLSGITGADSYTRNGGSCMAGPAAISMNAGVTGCGGNAPKTATDQVVVHPGTTTCNNPNPCTATLTAICGTVGGCSGGGC